MDTKYGISDIYKVWLGFCLMKSVRVLVLLIGVLACFGFVEGATYYVGTTGNDSDSGNESNPWLSIGFHLYGGPNLMSSGDIMIIKNGTYNENETAAGGLYNTISNLTLRGESREGVQVNFYGTATGGFYPDDAGLSLYDMNISSNLANGRCVKIRDNTKDFIIQNVRFKNCAYGIDAYFSTGRGENAIIQNNIFVNVSSSAITTDSFGNNWLNSTFINNIIINSTFLGSVSVTGYNDPSNLTIQNNTITNQPSYIISSDAHSLDYINNNIHFIKITIQDMQFEDAFSIENKFIEFYNLTGSAYQRHMYIKNSSNIEINNITYCSLSRPCTIGEFSSGLSDLISIDSDSRNISIKNSSFYFETLPGGGTSQVISSSGENVLINNNYFWYNATSGHVVSLSGNNSQIHDNEAYVVNNSFSYLWSCGSESLPGTGRLFNCSIKNNLAYANYDNASTSLHTIFLGYTDSSLVQNNTIYGGGYGHVIKGNTNSIIENGFIYDYPNNNGIYEKGGTNNIFRNYYIQCNGWPIYAARNSVDNFTVTNSTYENITISCATGEDCLVRILDNTSASFYDVVGYENLSVLEDADASVYYSLTVSGQDDVSFTITDNQSVEYDFNTDTYVTRYFLVGEENSTLLTNYSSFSYSAIKYGETQTGTFVLSEPYTLTLPTFTETTSSGGSSSATPTYHPDVEKLKQGYRISLGDNYKVSFEVGGSSHSFRVDDIFEDYVIVTVSSEPVTFEVRVGESEKVDVDGDGVYDLEVYLESVDGGRADFVLNSISEVVVGGGGFGE